jgi:hypothetical protein
VEFADRNLNAAGGGGSVGGGGAEVGGWAGGVGGCRDGGAWPLQREGKKNGGKGEKGDKRGKEGRGADVVAVANGTGARIENARYSAYGLPTVISDADFNHDGVVDSDDEDDFDDDFKTLLERADVDWDGDLDSADEALFAAAWTDADNSGLFKGYGDERGHLSIYGLRKGYAGYENDGIIEKLAHVRNRVLDHETGRWTRGDPAGYVDGENLLSFNRDGVPSRIDSDGMASLLTTTSNANTASPNGAKRVASGLAACRRHATGMSNWCLSNRLPYDLNECHAAVQVWITQCYDSCGRLPAE